MNLENTEFKATPKTRAKPTTDYLRIKKETKRKILSELSQINKKDFGQAVTPDQYVALAISLLSPEHIEQLKNATLSNKDRLELKYQEYCKTQKKVSMDEYIGILLGTKST